MAFLKLCNKFFKTSNLYEILSCTNDSSSKQIRQSYYKLSLKVHPDRVTDEEKEKAKEKFQVLGKVYSILSDKDKKKVYDETGEIPDDDSFGLSEDKDWLHYWRNLFPKVTIQDIADFEKKYRGSEEELNDIKNAYNKYEGNMSMILETVYYAEVESEERFREIITDLIKAGELEPHEAFTKESKKTQNRRKKKAKSEAAEAEKMLKELQNNSKNSLTALIQSKNASREQQFSNFCSRLEEKYAQPKKKSKKTK